MGLPSISSIVEIANSDGKIEAELPFFLRSFGLLLEFGVPFEKAFAMAQCNGKLKNERDLIVAEMASGLSFGKALSNFAMRHRSLMIKRAANQIIGLYTRGCKGEEIRKIADDFLALQRHTMKEHAARSTIFGMVLVLLNSIAPTFLLIFSISGKLGFGIELTETQIFVGFLVIIPLMSALVLFISKFMEPVSNEGVAGTVAVKRDDWLLLLPVLGLVLSVITALVSKQKAIVYYIAPICILAWVYSGYSSYRKDRDAESIDARLPDMLLAINGMPKSLSLDRLFGEIENGGFGLLSKEAGKSKVQMSLGLGRDEVLDDLWKRNKSKTLELVCTTMKQLIATNSIEKISMLADDIANYRQFMRDRGEMFAMQKYTLISGAIILPLILKIAIGLIVVISGIDKPNSMGVQLLGSLEYIIPAYLITYAVIVSIAIAFWDNKRSSFSIYSLGLSSVSLAIFYFINL